MDAPLRFPSGVYGITPEWEDTDRLLDAISAAAAGGMVALQWRRKTATLQTGPEQARRVVAHCQSLGVLAIINDDWRLAILTGADGVHLGRSDGELPEARLALGQQKILGCSCYNDVGLAQQALAAGVDYIAFGAMYPSTIKPDAPRATIQHIAQGRQLAAAYSPGPRAAVVVIGGITPDNAAPLIAAGADSLALINGLFERPDIQATAAQLAMLWH
ncbi:MAG: thiamine phosphate synthase [Burkholderiaceae bacterium]|nr:thiamine phosphate synthase [Burkholderiaceae bacterium]